MNTLTIESRGKIPWIGLILLIPVFLLLVLSIANRDLSIAVGALLPASWSLYLVLTRLRPLKLEATLDEIRCPKRTIAMHEVQWVSYGGGAPDPDNFPQKAKPIRVHHRWGAIDLTKQSTPPPWQIYPFLRYCVDATRSANVLPSLRDWTTEQRNAFGQELVHVFAARQMNPTTRLRSKFRWLSGIAFAVGMIWILLAAQRYVSEMFFGIGSVSALIGGVAWLCSFLTHNRLAAQASDSMLVISPAGIALQQMKLKGMLPWSQILTLPDTPKPNQSLSRTKGIQIKVEGADFWILDIYDRPIFQILRLLKDYHEPKIPETGVSNPNVT